MKRKLSRRHKTGRRNSRRQSSSTLRNAGIIFLAALVVFVGVKVYKTLRSTHVLGTSLLAEDNPPPGGGGGGGGGGSGDSGGGGGGGGGGQPPQEQQPPQQQQPPQGGQPPQQGQQPPQQPAQQNQGQQPNQQSGQQQYRPNNQPNQQPPQGDQQQQYRQQYQQNNQQTQQNQPNDQRGNQQMQFSGDQQNPQQGGGRPSPNESAEQRQQFQQFQEQFKQEAAKNGFQFSGSLPPQFQQLQSQQAGNGQSGGQNRGEGSPNSGPGSWSGQNFQALPGIHEFPTITGRFEVRGQGGGENIDLNDPNTRIQLFSQNSSLNMRVKRPDGTEVPIDKEALEKINTAMKLETGSEVSHSGDQFIFKRGGIEAQTRFPISFNVATKTFSVQTGSGEQEFKVFPDDAVQGLIHNKNISQGATPPTVTLTEFNNKPVFEVQGSLEKKFLGFMPVSISKKTFVSAETGDVVTTNQGILSKFLERISF